ncbi:hypothetical protein BsWGS_24075 [Bradybaena similaris]
MAYSPRRYGTNTEPAAYSNGNKIYIPGSLSNLPPGEQISWTDNHQFAMPSSSFDRLFQSENFRNAINDDDLQRSQIVMPPPLPKWIWSILVTTLHIGSETSQKKKLVATFLHVLTLTSAFLFGSCGLFFNAYDTLSETTKTTVLVCIVKSVLGLYWIGLGIYANTLATRLFSNKRMVDCIRLHSKTIFKVNTAFIVMLLSLSVVVGNLYSSQSLLESHMPSNGTLVSDANCVHVGVDVFLCKVYFGSKIVYSCLCLLWNLLVVGIFLSVCRTHTISIRRFMKELLYDSKIFLEFHKIQALEKHIEYMQSVSEDPQKNQQPASGFSSDTNIWDDDIVGMFSETDIPSEPPANAQLLQYLRILWFSTRDQLENDIATSLHLQDIAPSVHIRDDVPLSSWAEEDEYIDTEGTKEAAPADTSNGTIQMQPVIVEHDQPDTQDVLAPETMSPPKKKSADEKKKPLPGPSEDNKNRPHSVDQSSQVERKMSVLAEMGPPIMTNEDLLFAYFQLLRRLSATSRLLQRWIANWVTFVMLWCALMIVYWTSHTAQLSGISQFLIPLVTLGLLTSGYAEVNFEGERLSKCVLPTEDRMPVIYYFQNSKLELKIFSFTMTYNTIVTVIAGIAVTFATRIILDQVNLGKGHHL